MEQIDIPQERRYCSKLGFSVLAIMLWSILWQFGLYWLDGWILPFRIPETLYYLLLLVGHYAVSLPIVFCLWRKTPPMPFCRERAGAKRMGRWFVIGCALMWLGSLIGTNINDMVYTLTGRDPVGMVDESFSQMSMTAIVLGACIIGPLCEELVFRGLLAAEPLRSLHAALAADEDALTGAVAAFEAALFARGTNWTEALLDAVLEEENLCLRVAAGQDAGPVLETALNSELDFLQTLGRAPLDEVFPGAAVFLPRWETTPDADYHAAYEARRAAMGQKGYGMFARHHVFALEDGHLVPVRYPDPQRLSELPGYEQEREKVIANTRALLEGRPANNVLLYGDAGTGKSSTVKAIANEFAPDGLRLIEVKKNQLYQIPALMDELAKNPLKFILFIDDLSFASNDDNFAALKAILEGGVGGRSHNVAVYATSNRRHLVKETMADRSGDDLHAMDTRQELMSLSARFGLTVTFQQPDKDRYDRILLELAKQYNVQMPSDQLFIKGAAFALRAGGRSPRVAKQFVELLAAGVKV